jgi:histidyl-tRNA synthetase
MERLILLLQQENELIRRSPVVFMAALGESARTKGFLLVQQLRSFGIETEFDYEGRSLKSQMRRADKLGVRHVLILGEEEMNKGEIQVRDMLNKTQSTLPLSSAALALQETLK